jgi:hypothetical protein
MQINKCQKNSKSSSIHKNCTHKAKAQSEGKEITEWYIFNVNKEKIKEM